MNELIKAINELKKEKNAIILGHYYQKGEIQDIADYVGDSLALAQWAAKTEADIIVMCGVHFMGETAKVLCPNKKVLVPDMEAGCSLADSCPADKFAPIRLFWKMANRSLSPICILIKQAGKAGKEMSAFV